MGVRAAGGGGGGGAISAMAFVSAVIVAVIAGLL